MIGDDIKSLRKTFEEGWEYVAIPKDQALRIADALEKRTKALEKISFMIDEGLFIEEAAAAIGVLRAIARKALEEK